METPFKDYVGVSRRSMATNSVVQYGRNSSSSKISSLSASLKGIRSIATKKKNGDIDFLDVQG